MQKLKRIEFEGSRTMANNPCLSSAFVFVVLALLKLSGVVVCNFGPCQQIPVTENDALKFAMNFQCLGAEFFLNGALGRGLDAIDPSLASGGPPPFAPQMANLDHVARRIVEEFGYQEVGQLKDVIGAVVGGFQRPLLNLSRGVFADLFDQAVGFPLNPPFDPYANTLNFFLTANIITYTGLVGLVGAEPFFSLLQYRSLVARLLAMEAGQNAVIRTFLYQRADDPVVPYKITVAEFTNLTSALSNRLGKCGFKDEGVVVPRSLGAENRTESNILAADERSLSYSRTLQELLRIAYGTGDESVAGGLFPRGANGNIAKSFLRRGN